MTDHHLPAKASASEAVEDEQARFDREQTLADADQLVADRDQVSADREQAAADSDQAASDRDLVRGGDAEAHNSSRQVRTRTAKQRHYSSQGRVEAASARDQVAASRDLTALERDRQAEERDRLRPMPDPASADEASEVIVQAVQKRAGAAADRAVAAQGRARAAADRQQAADDREEAAGEVLRAHAERAELLDRLATAERDGLTGTRSRARGLEDLDHEIARARRTESSLVIAYIDVVGLKAVNDLHGHSAGDALLQRAVNTMRAHLRSYDLIVRIGGDEFLAVIPGATLDHARQRFAAIDLALATDPDPSQIKVGFAVLEPDDDATGLIQRADAELPASTRG